MKKRQRPKSRPRLKCRCCGRVSWVRHLFGETWYCYRCTGNFTAPPPQKEK